MALKPHYMQRVFANDQNQARKAHLWQSLYCTVMAFILNIHCNLHLNHNFSAYITAVS